MDVRESIDSFRRQQERAGEFNAPARRERPSEIEPCTQLQSPSWGDTRNSTELAGQDTRLNIRVVGVIQGIEKVHL